MAENVRWGNYQREISLVEQDRKFWLTPNGRRTDAITSAEIRSIWARTVDDYIDILTHNGAPNILEYAQTQLREDAALVDAGCAAGVALTQIRSELPRANLFGIDVRDVTKFRLTDTTMQTDENVGGIFRQYRITFFQDSYLNILKRLPRGYDLLLCVGAYLDTGFNSSLVYEGLKTFYDGLHSGGMGQIFLDAEPETYHRVLGALDRNGIIHQFHEANLQVMHDRHQGLFRPNSVTGTLTLGPK